MNTYLQILLSLLCLFVIASFFFSQYLESFASSTKRDLTSIINKAEDESTAKTTVMGAMVGTLGREQKTQTGSSSTGGDNVIFLDRQRPRCGEGEVMTGFRILPDDNDKNRAKYELDCAPVDPALKLQSFNATNNGVKQFNVRSPDTLTRMWMGCYRTPGEVMNGFRLSRYRGWDDKNNSTHVRYISNCVKPILNIDTKDPVYTICETNTTPTVDVGGGGFSRLSPLSVSCPESTALRYAKLNMENYTPMAADCPGYNLSNLGNKTISQCKSACYKNNECRGFSFNAGGKIDMDDRTKGTCILKNKVCCGTPIPRGEPIGRNTPNGWVFFQKKPRYYYQYQCCGANPSVEKK